jgi:uncharacterized membrane protein HdeD (DUF308 family)
MPAMTALFLVSLIAGWAILGGAFQIASAIRLRKAIKGEWLLALAGVGSIVFGVLVLLAPLAGAVVLAWWIGAFALVFGVVQIALGFKLRSWSRRESSSPGVLRAA